MKKYSIWHALIAILICQGAGIVGSLFTAPAIPTWYAELIKPSWNPPSWVFAPVWTTLYTLMGIAVYRVWRKGYSKKQVKCAVQLFGLQLVANSAWSIIFFGWQNLFLALIEIVILVGLIYFVIIRFARIDKTAAWLMVPYAVWSTFAAYLTYTIWMLNL